MTPSSHRERAIAVAQQRGIARGRDFDAAGVPRTYLQRLRDEGVFQQVGRGLYRLADHDASAHASLAEAVRIRPGGVIALLSALQFHGLTTQTPHRVWMLLAPGVWTPVNPSVQLRIVRASGDALTTGAERHTIDGVEVPITDRVKTVVDCFKYRSLVGQDVAVEALRDLLKAQRPPLDLLRGYAETDRVERVMRPYLEALV